MMNKTNLNEFLSILLNNGKINSRRLRREYFENINKVGLFDEFVEATDHSNKSLKDKVNLAIRGFVDSYPKCKICGKECTLVGRTISKYCSKECALKDSDRNEKIRESKKNADPSTSNEKRKQTMLAKYGVEYNSQRKDIHSIWTKSKLTEEILSKLSNKSWLHREYITNNRCALDIAKELNCDFSTVLSYCRSFNFPIRQHYNKSSIETDVINWLKEKEIDCISGYRNAYTDNREIDIFIPSRNIGIEINGLYWHSDKFKERLYHRNKKFEAKDIRLIQITDYQWKHKKEICQSIILNAIGRSNKIGARKCTVETYSHSTKEIRSFFEENHMDGFVGGFFYAILRYNKNIVAGIILGKSRFHKENKTELLRYVCLKNTNIVGGFNRLIESYRNEHNEEIFSYVNLSLFDATLYKANKNWEFVGYTNVGYFWTDGDIIVSRYKAMKKNLQSWLPNYDPSLSESDNMIQGGFYRYYDCGNAVYKLSRK